MVSKDVKGSKRMAEEGPGSQHLLGGGQWLAARGVRCERNVGSQGPNPLQFGLERLTAGDISCSWGQMRGPLGPLSSAVRRGLPAPPGSRPQLPGSASGQRPARREAGRADGARSARPSQPGAQPRGPGGRGSAQRAGGPNRPRGTGRGRPTGGGAGGIQAGGASADWPGAAT